MTVQGTPIYFRLNSLTIINKKYLKSHWKRDSNSVLMRVSFTRDVIVLFELLAHPVPIFDPNCKMITKYVKTAPRTYIR